MGCIRVLLVHMPAMLSDILGRAVAAQPDMSVVGEVAHLEQLCPMEGAAAPDVLIIGLDGTELPPSWRHLLELRPSLKVLVLTMGGRRAILYASNAPPKLMPEVSTEVMLQAIRATAGSPPSPGI